MYWLAINRVNRKVIINVIAFYDCTKHVIDYALQLLPVRNTPKEVMQFIGKKKKM